MAGIIGSVLPRYCVVGETVNIAARMKSTGSRKYNLLDLVNFLNQLQISPILIIW